MAIDEQELNKIISELRNKTSELETQALEESKIHTDESQRLNKTISELRNKISELELQACDDDNVHAEEAQRQNKVINELQTKIKSLEDVASTVTGTAPLESVNAPESEFRTYNDLQKIIKQLASQSLDPGLEHRRKWRLNDGADEKSHDNGKVDPIPIFQSK